MIDPILKNIVMSTLYKVQYNAFMQRVQRDYESITEYEFEQFKKLQILMWETAEEQDKIRNSNGTQKEE